MNVIEISALRKTFPKSRFTLSLPEFAVEEGYVTGFIGENGAGKTTTLKLIMDMIYADEGAVTVFGLDSHRDGKKIREQISYIGEQPGYLDQAKLKNIKKMVAPFYSDWEESAFENYAKRFSLDLNKKYKDLSKGKQKQFALAVALSHHPRLLLMDEPTANLDPLVRQEILDILADEMQREGVTVFFSTHITSDLDKIADYVHFLHGGRLILSQDKDSLIESHRVVKARIELLTPEIERNMIDVERSDFGFRGLCDCPRKIHELLGDEAIYEKPTIEDIFINYTKMERGKS
ncbi:ABC transporter ATP-binding protein [Anaerotruncus rubiinfantis]|uniref:ABC transporter ATP-binding protein n=1 Tax=Anaerotruncus rubiinfantis TaxID=1720200 RepID=UPI00082B807C|nr:ABC transporter ATP-binding protein [Anaerotruncus rubiinfantis]